MSLIGPYIFCELIKGLEEILLSGNNEEFIKMQLAEAEKPISVEKKDEVKEEVKIVNIQGTDFHLREKVIKELPYFESLLSGRYQTSETESGVAKCDSVDPELFKVIVKFIENNKKLYVLFGHLPKEQSAFELLRLFDFLCLKAPIDIDFENIKSMLLEPNYSIMTSQEDIIKFSFALFFANGKIEWKERSQRKYRNAIYEKINHVLHCKDEWAQPRAKYHLKNLSLKCVTFSMNQYLRIFNFSVPEKSLDSNDKESIQCLISSSLYHGLSDYSDSDSECYLYDSDFDYDDYFGDSPCWSDPEDMFDFLDNGERMCHYKMMMGEDFDYGEYFAGEYLHLDKYVPI